MTKNELIATVNRELAIAHAALSELSMDANGSLRQTSANLARHIRNASCAATMIESLAAGNKVPKRGD